MSVEGNVQKEATQVTSLFVASESDPYFRLKTSQKETFSDATILGLKDVFYKNEPDLSYYCDKCKVFISLTSLSDHRTYHAAVRCLELDSIYRAHTSSDFLLKQRNKLLKDLKSGCIGNNESFNIEKAKKIDDAYEFLKQDVEDTFESCRKLDENLDPNVEGFDIDCSLHMVQAIGYCSNDNSRWKASMEDTKVYQDHFGNDSTKAFVALYDGYNGKYAASVAANELHYLFLNELCNLDSKLSCTCTFNMLEENDITGYDFIRPPSPTAGHQPLLHRNSTNMIQQIVYTCEEPANQFKHLSTHHPVTNVDENRVLKNSATSKRVDEVSDRRVKAAFKVAYKMTDRVLSHGGDETSRVRWSGCSALTLLAEDSLEQLSQSAEKAELDEKTKSEKVDANEKDRSQKREREASPPRTIGKLHLAHAGNCQAVLVRNNKSYPLLKMHTYDNEKERTRIESQGGTFSNSERARYLNGVSITTRGLGNHGDPTLRDLIIAEPQCTTVKVDQYCQFLIMATPGVWQALSHHEATDLMLQLLPQNRMPTPGYVSPSVGQLLQSLSVAENPPDAVSRTTDHTDIDETHDMMEELLQIPESPEHPGLQPTNPLKSASSPHVQIKVTDAAVSDSHITHDLTGNATQPGNSSKANLDAPSATVAGSCDGTYESSVVFKSEPTVKARSVDSGNEGDVDTDWASTVVPNEFGERSVSSNVSIERYMSRMLAERLVQAAILAGAKENLSVIVVLLPGTRL